MYRLFDPLPVDLVPERHENPVDPRGDGRISQGSFTIILPDADNRSRALGLVLDADGALFSVSDMSTISVEDPVGGTIVEREQAIAIFSRDGAVEGYHARGETLEEDEVIDGTAVPYRRLSAVEVSRLKALAAVILSRGAGYH